MRPFLVTCAALAITLGITGSASAGTVTVPNGATDEAFRQLAVFRAAPGEANLLTIRGCYLGPCGFRQLQFTDARAPLTGQPLVDSVGCAPADENPLALVCRPAWNVDAYLGDKDDDGRFGNANGNGRIWGGSGDDLVSITTDGAAEAYGEGGDDTLSAWSHGGGQLADGGPGDDDLRIGGLGEGAILGGPGSDRIWFTLDPAGSFGTLAGGSGNDHITFVSPGRAVAHGDDGADTMDVAPADLFRWFSSFTMAGDAGPDTLIGGPKGDVLDGGSGPDVIEAAGGGIDTITCGSGPDVVAADGSDLVAADCERVTLAPDPVE